jgi:hypothetical protein
MLSDYIGDCGAGTDDVQCLGFTFADDPPWEVDVAVRCRHPQYGLSSCRLASFGSTIEQADSDGLVRSTIEFSSAREETLLVEAVDTYGARKQQSIAIQIKRAQPQLEFYTDSFLEFGVENNVLTIDEPLRLECCDTNQETITKSISLRNMGNAEARIITVPTSDTPGLSVTMPAMLTIPPGESTDFEVTYDPRLAGEGEINANITLFGELGGGALFGSNKYEKYTTMVLPVTNNDGCGHGEIIGGEYYDYDVPTWSTKCNWATLTKNNVKQQKILPSNQAAFWIKTESRQSQVLKISGTSSQFDYRLSENDLNDGCVVSYRDEQSNTDYLLINPAEFYCKEVYIVFVNQTASNVQYELELINDPFSSGRSGYGTLDDSYISDRLIASGYSDAELCRAAPEYVQEGAYSNYYWHFEIEVELPIDTNGKKFDAFAIDSERQKIEPALSISSVKQEFIHTAFNYGIPVGETFAIVESVDDYIIQDMFGRYYWNRTKIDLEIPKLPGC